MRGNSSQQFYLRHRATTITTPKFHRKCNSLNRTPGNKTNRTWFHCVHVEDSVVDELASVICKSNPLGIAIAKDGPLSTSYKRKQYYTSNFKVVEPVEDILDAQKKRTFQYITLL